MKAEYKEKVLSHIDGVNSRAKTLREMIEGSRPSSQTEAIRFTKEIERLMEFIQNLVDVS